VERRTELAGHPGLLIGHAIKVAARSGNQPFAAYVKVIDRREVTADAGQAIVPPFKLIIGFDG
jgi:hypothetical protein